MKTEVLQSKLRPPVGCQGRLIRHRLLERLEEGRARGRKVSLLIAPAGYGKTSVATQWVESHNGAWLTMDERDSTRPRFMLYLAAALEPIYPGLSDWMDRVLRSPQLPPADLLVERLVARIEALSDERKAGDRSCILAIDDYHEISSREVHRALASLIRYLPASLHLLMCSREDPPLPLALLRGRGEMTELREADLRFTDQETARYLSEVEGLDLDPRVAADLHVRTEGWVTALHLAALAIRGAGLSDGNPLARLQGLPGESTVIDFLFGEVLSGQRPEAAAFMVLSSIFDRFSRESCDAILLDELPGVDGCGAVIESILRANLFIVPLDGTRTWFRYHRLFRDLLFARLNARFPGLAEKLHERASKWFWEKELREEAVEHAFSSGNPARAAELVETVSRMIAVWSSVNLHAVIRWFHRLPQGEAEARPWLRLLIARILFVAGQTSEGNAMLERLVRGLSPGDDEESRMLRTTAAIDLASFATVFGRVRQAFGLLDALPPLAKEDARRARVHAARGMTHIRAGELARAEEEFSRALDAAEGPAYAMIAGTLLCNLSEVSFLRGHLHAALESSERALETSLQGSITSPAAGIALVQKARILYEWNRLEEGFEAVQRGLELTSAAGVTDAFGLGRITCARIQLARGQVRESEDLLRETLSIVRWYRVPRLTDVVEACHVRLLLCTKGMGEEVARWVSRFSVERPTEYIRDREELVCARVELAQGLHDRALARTESLLKRALDTGRGYTVLEAGLVKALALFAMGSKSKAFDIISQVLETAEPEGFFRLFLDEGRLLHELLRQARSQAGIPRYGEAVILALEGAPDMPPRGELTAREQEILVLVAERLSNEEIGERLYVSLPTVKTHISHILAKLGVSSRREAAARAAELGLR